MPRHNGTLYDYSAGSLCGVLVKENVMRKLVRLQQEHLHAVKEILANGADNGEVFPSMWTLYKHDCEQTTVHFIDLSVDVRKRISCALVADNPLVRHKVYIADSMDAARVMAQEDAECSS